VREFLSDRQIPFVDRNIRQSREAQDELAARTGGLVVPQLLWREHRIVGFDPVALDELTRAYAEQAT
jgi:hypothetical protein